MGDRGHNRHGPKRGRMPFGTEVGLGPGDIVLDAAQLPPHKRDTAAPPTFPPMSIVVKRSPVSSAELLFGKNDKCCIL